MSYPLAMLGTVATFINGDRGKNYPSKGSFIDDGIPFISAGNLSGGLLNVSSFNYISDERFDLLSNGKVKNGDILFCLRGSLGKFAVVKNLDRGAIASSLIIIRNNDNVLLSFLKHYLSSPLCRREIDEFENGAAQPNLSAKDLKSFKIPLPPLKEQKKIAEILDAADSLRQKDKQLVEHYNRLSQSLFLDMFGDPVCNMKKWETKKLEDVASSQLGKMLSQAAKKGINAQKYLRNANVRWGYFNLDNMLEMDFTDKEIKKFNLLTGDILVCEGGEVGRAAIWRNDLEDCYFQKALHRVRVNNEMMTPEYLQAYFYWMSKLGGLSSSTSEVTFSHLTAEKLKKLVVPLPPVSLQNEYSSKLSYVEKQKELAQQALQKSEDLFNSLLQQAFKGELTNS